MINIYNRKNRHFQNMSCNFIIILEIASYKEESPTILISYKLGMNLIRQK